MFYHNLLYMLAQGFLDAAWFVLQVHVLYAAFSAFCFFSRHTVSLLADYREEYTLPYGPWLH